MNYPEMIAMEKLLAKRFEGTDFELITESVISGTVDQDRTSFRIWRKGPNNTLLNWCATLVWWHETGEIQLECYTEKKDKKELEKIVSATSQTKG